MTPEQFERLLALLERIVMTLEEKKQREVDAATQVYSRGMPAHHIVTEPIGWQMARHVEEREVKP